MKLLNFLVLVWFVASCSPGGQERQANPPQFNSSSLSNNAEQTANLDALSNIDTADICRAAVSKVFGADFEAISEYKFQSGISYVQYRRASDNSRWRVRCKTDGDRVVWGSVDDGEVGRWRDGPSDEKLTFEVHDDQIVIQETFSDGSGSSEAFRRESVR